MIDSFMSIFGFKRIATQRGNVIEPVDFVARWEDGSWERLLPEGEVAFEASYLTGSHIIYALCESGNSFHINLGSGEVYLANLRAVK